MTTTKRGGEETLAKLKAAFKDRATWLALAVGTAMPPVVNVVVLVGALPSWSVPFAQLAACGGWLVAVAAATYLMDVQANIIAVLEARKSS